jgi:hypothetical protein
MLPLWEARTLLGTLPIMNMQSSRTSISRKHRRRKERQKQQSLRLKLRRRKSRNLRPDGGLDYKKMKVACRESDLFMSENLNVTESQSSCLIFCT